MAQYSARKLVERVRFTARSLNDFFFEIKNMMMDNGM